jgi:hypothetical protein
MKFGTQGDPQCLRASNSVAKRRLDRIVTHHDHELLAQSARPASTMLDFPRCESCKYLQRAKSVAAKDISLI